MFDPNSARNPAALCWLCSFKATGWTAQAIVGSRASGPTPRLPEYLACSRACTDQLVSLIKRGNGSIDMAQITEMEKRAVIAARLMFYNALVEAGVAAPFVALSASQIDKIILAAVEGFRASMQQQSANGEVPF